MVRICIIVLIKNWQDGVFINVQPAPNCEKNNIMYVYAYWKHELFFVHYLDLGLFILFYITGISHTFRFCKIFFIRRFGFRGLSDFMTTWVWGIRPPILLK